MGCNAHKRHTLNMKSLRGHSSLLILLTAMASAQTFPAQDPWVSHGRKADSQTKILSEIRESERRKLPIEVALKARTEYKGKEPVAATISITNLFDKPILINSRMLVNHILLPGEVAFKITGPDGKKCEIQRLITPLTVGQDDFVLLPRGMSVQRTVDLSDIYPLTKKGTYKIEAIYHNELDGIQASYKAWRGQAKSDPIEITLH